MANTILGIFDDPIDARRAVEALHAGPLKLDDVSVKVQEKENGQKIRKMKREGIEMQKTIDSIQRFMPKNCGCPMA